MLRPPPARSGDIVRLIAPSGPFDRTLFWRALGWLSRRYRVIWNRGALERQGYLAGNDRRRLNELDEALADPNASALIAVRGGYGATRICHAANFENLRRYPKWCVGFSDITALHLEAARVGVCSLHASNLTALGRGDQSARNAWVDALENPSLERRFGSLTTLAGGNADGVLAGGNLSLLFAMAAAGRLRLPASCILFLEEVNEAPYRIDRMLTALVIGGHLSSVAGVCIGDLGESSSARLREALDVLYERLQPLRVPVLAGLPIGHGLHNEPLQLGAPAAIRGTGGLLVINPDSPSRNPTEAA